MSKFDMDEGFVVATIMSTKEKHFGETFVTFRELNIIQSILQDEFNSKKLNVSINDNIDRDYFEVLDGVIVLNDERCISFSKVVGKYIASCPSIDILNIVWNDEFIYKNISKMKRDEYSGLPYIPAELDEIIEKILDNPNDFYEKVAQELSSKEYGFINERLKEKATCANCRSNCSGGPNDYKCNRWSNDVLVGRAKVLSKV